MTDQQKENLRKIYAKSEQISERNKRQAVRDCDFDTSLRIASNQAQVEQFFRDAGVDVSVKLRGANWIILKP